MPSAGNELLFNLKVAITMWFVVICLIVIIVCVCVGVSSNSKNSNSKKIDNRTQIQKEKDWQASWDKWHQERGSHPSRKQEYINVYGECSADITYRGRHFYVFEQSQVIILSTVVIPFNKIIGYNLTDNQVTISENVGYESKTTTSTGSMLGRAVVGGVLTGGVGAVIGAATAKKNTVTTPSQNNIKTSVTHDFNIYINLNDLSNPTIIISVGNNIDTAYKIANILNIIVERNKQI